MKKLFCIMAAITLMGISINATYGQVSDTTAYLEDLEKNKDQYIGKTFSEFEKNLKIKIVVYVPLPASSDDITKEGCSVFHFKKETTEADFEKSTSIIIYWKEPLNQSEILQIRKKYGNLDWNQEAMTHYKNGIIRKIEVFD